MLATTIGIDLAKHVFQLHGVDQHGKTVLTRKLKPDKMISFFANLPSCLIGMEARGSAHFWAKNAGVGAYRQADCPVIRQALRQNKQKRCC